MRFTTAFILILFFLLMCIVGEDFSIRAFQESLLHLSPPQSLPFFLNCLTLQIGPQRLSGCEEHLTALADLLLVFTAADLSPTKQPLACPQRKTV